MLISHDKIHELQKMEIEAFNEMFPTAKPLGKPLFKPLFNTNFFAPPVEIISSKKERKKVFDARTGLSIKLKEEAKAREKYCRDRESKGVVK